MRLLVIDMSNRKSNRGNRETKIRDFAFGDFTFQSALTDNIV